MSRRMLCTDITRSDAFLEMPQSTRLLYYDLVQEGDDEGFVDNPKMIMKLTGATDGDMQVLLEKKFVILPDEIKGIVVIKHWFIHNYIRADRKKETNYKELKALLDLDENNCYTMNGSQVPTKCLPSGSISKDKLSKDKISKFIPPTLKQIETYCKERNNNVNAKRFYDYYTASDWKDSKGKPVKNWKQKVITWERDDPKTKKDELPTYSIKNNKNMKKEEADELLRLMGKK